MSFYKILKIFPKVSIVLWLLFCASFSQGLQRALNQVNPSARETILEILERAQSNGIPAAFLENKVLEGVAKGKSEEQIIKAMEIRAARLNSIHSKQPAIQSHAYSPILFDLERDQTNLIYPNPSKIGFSNLNQKSPSKGFSLKSAIPSVPNSPKINGLLDSRGTEKASEKGVQKMEKALEKQETAFERRTQKMENALERRLRAAERARGRQRN